MQEPKGPRTIDDVHIEMQAACGQIGFMQYQIEREMPSQIEKLMNQVQSLQKELDKFTRQQEEQQKALDTMKEINGKKVDLKSVETVQ